MLEMQKFPPMIDHEPSRREAAGVDDITTELASAVLRIFRRQYLILVFFLLFAVSCGVVYLRIAPPSYVAQSRILIDRGRSPFVQQQSILAEAPVDAIQLDSQVQILRSDGIALAVVKKLNLTEDPEFVASEVGLPRSIADFLSISLPTQPRTESQLTQQAVAAVLANLDIKRVGITYLIDISFRSRRAERAAEIANAVADAYIADQLESKREANRRANEWLQDRLGELRRQTLEAEQKVYMYKADNNIVAAGGKLMSEQEISEINSQLVIARTKTSEALARLNRIDAVLQLSVPSEALVDATVTDALSSPIIMKLRQEYLDYINKESEYSERYGRGHFAVVNIRSKLRDIRVSISSELHRLAETFKSDYLIAKQREDSVEQQLAASVSQSQSASVAQVPLRELESAAQGSRSLYNSFQQRFLESTQQQSFPIPDARVVSSAAVPAQKNSPKALIVLGASIIGGLMLGGGIGLLRELTDRVFRTGRQIESRLRLPCVALVPLLMPEGRGRNKTPYQIPLNGHSHTLPVQPRTIIPNWGAIWTVLNSPQSHYAEAIRSMKLTVDLSGLRAAGGVVGLTSSQPGEGKSTIALAFAQLVAQTGSRVIIVDCDLRNPSISRLLAPTASGGLIEVLRGRSTIGEVIWTEPLTNMAFLPTATDKGLGHTSEILASVATKKLIEQLREKYDYVVIDLPPITASVDVRATTHLVDFYFFVVEWGRTRIDVVQRSLDAADRMGDKLAGIVLNKADMDTIGHYDAYPAMYYGNKGYAPRY